MIEDFKREVTSRAKRTLDKNNRMMSLGGYGFRSNYNPYHELSETIEYNYQSRDTFNETERHEFKGKKANVITMNLCVVISSEADKKIIPALKALGNSGKSYPLMGYKGLVSSSIGDDMDLVNMLDPLGQAIKKADSLAALSGNRGFRASLYGDYFVKSVMIKQTEFTHDGIALIQEATLTLIEDANK